MLANLGHHPVAARLLNNKITAAILPPPFGKFQDWSVEQVKNRMENLEKADRDDMLSHFCRMKADDGTPASLYDVLIEAMTLMWDSSREHLSDTDI